MKKIALSLTVLALTLTGGSFFLKSNPVVPSVYAREIGPDFSNLVERLSPAVVNISTRSTVKSSPLEEFQFHGLPPGFDDFFRQFFDQGFGGSVPQQKRKVTSLGSGFVIDPKGIVVTNNHVIDGADEIEVNFSDGTSQKAELVGTDPKTDLAVLKIKDTSKTYPAVSFADSDTAKVGQWVVAIGNPFGLGGTVTAGIISARNRNINAGPYDDFIQTDAAINRGNSGGPLFNMDGGVIGINSAIISPSGGSVGIGFSIPSNIAMNVVRQLQENGKVERGWIGVSIQEVTSEIAESIGLGFKKGAMIAGIQDNTPADKAGLKKGDVILKFNGYEIKDVRDLPRLVASTPVGTKAPLTVWRKGKEEHLTITVEQQDKHTAYKGKKDTQGSSYIADLGIKVHRLDEPTRYRYRLGDESDYGLVITHIDRNSDVYVRGMRIGDVILEIQQQPVRSPDELEAALTAIRKAGRSAALLTVSRGGEARFLAVRLMPR